MPTTSPRDLRALDAEPGSGAVWADALGAALAGRGPALMPLPSGPGAVRAELLAAFRPDDHAAPLEGDDTVLVVPTSGSTGEPKGAVLGAGAVRASVEATAARLGGHGRWVLALPLTHVAGLMVVARAVIGGTQPVEVEQPAGFDPGAFAAATAEGARACAADGRPLYVSLVPTQLGRLLDAGVDLGAYTALLLGAAPTPVPLRERAAAAGARVVTTYGMSETCGGCVYDGVPLDGVGVAIGGDGRVHLSGPMLFTGYRLRPDLTAAALDDRGRFVTGDLGRLADGRLRVLGRADDVIVSGGENVVPARVEAVLGSSPALASVGAWVVVGVPDDRWGERVVAVAVTPAGAAAPSADAVRAAAAGQLPSAWVPRAVVVCDHVPMLATGKVDRAAASALAARLLATPSVGSGAGS